MFQSVIEEQGWRSGRFGAGMGISTLVHAALLASALVFSTQKVQEPENDTPLDFTRYHPPQPPKGSPHATPKVATQTKPKPAAKPKDFVQPREVKPVVAEPVNTETPPPEETVDEPVEGVLGGHPDGLVTGGVLGAAYIPGLATVGGGSGSGEDVLPFGSGMTRPELLSGGDLQYTREALEARVEGSIVAKCTITREGEVERCRIIKGLPHMDEAVLSSLTSRRYRPVTFQGKAVSVSYTFNVRLEMP
jgi:protein TonB